MKTKLALTALLVLASATAVEAKTIKYTFGISGGGTYCDGLTLTQNGVSWGGTHTGSCIVDQDQAGGLEIKVIGGSTKYLDIATSQEAEAPGTVETFFLDLKGQAWYLYETTGGAYTLINSGPLIKGAPPAQSGAKLASSPK